MAALGRTRIGMKGEHLLADERRRHGLEQLFGMS